MIEMLFANYPLFDFHLNLNQIRAKSDCAQGKCNTDYWIPHNL